MIAVYIVIILLTGVFVYIPSVRSDPTDLSNWNYRKKITINQSMVQSDLTDFPVLINLDSDNNLKTHAQPDGDDILFTDNTGVILSHEIEQYDSSTGHLTAWIKIPNLSSTEDTILYMYYGNPSSINQQNPEEVWDSNYVMVQHFKDTTGTRYDSTSNNFDATPINVNHISTGAINGADTFNGLTSYLNLGTNSNLQPTTGTISVWLNATATDGIRTIYTGSKGGSIRRHPWLIINNGAVRLFLTNNIFEEGHFAGTYISANEMHFVTVTWDGANTILYIDGVTVKTETQNIVPAGNTNTKRIGGLNPPFFPQVFAGMLDELRLSNIPRNAGYIKTCYNNQYSPNTFYNLSAEESLILNQPPVLLNPTPANNSIGNPLSFSWSILINDPDGDTFNWSIECSNGQSTSGNGASNGTKSLSLSGLTYFTTYSIWVNATDPSPGSGQYISRWYKFTTISAPGPLNHAPVLLSQFPVNGSTELYLNATLSVVIQDLEGDSIAITFMSNASGTWQIIGTYNGGNDTYSQITTNMNALNKTYYWNVYVNDGKAWTNASYHFKTATSIVPTLKWSNTAAISGYSQVGPTIADVNADGYMEIVRTGETCLEVINGSTGVVLWSYAYTPFSPHVLSEIIDLNKDGIPEIIFSKDTGTIALHGNNGSVYWYNPNAPLYEKYPVAGDINADGYPEVYVVNHGSITALTHDGQIFAQKWSYHSCWGGLSLAYNDIDGQFYVIQGDRNNNYEGGMGVKCWYASNLTLKWYRDTILCSSQCPAVADVNKDGHLDIVVLQQDGGGVVVLDLNDGHSIRETNSIPGMRCHSPPPIYDIDNDGNLELIACRGYSSPIVWDLVTWTRDAQLPYGCDEPPAIADIDGDGNVEIIACTQNNGITIFNNKYQIIGSIPINDANAYVIPQDVDNDGLIELVFNKWAGIYVYDTIASAPTPRALTQFQMFSQYRGRNPYYNPYGPLTPLIKNELPVNQNITQPLNPTLFVYLYDYQDNLMNINFSTNASSDGVWHQIGTTQTGYNGIYTQTTTEMNSYSTKYWWRVNVTDSTGKSASKLFEFTTIDQQVISNPNPANESKEVFINPKLSVHCQDIDGDLMNIMFKTNASSDGFWYQIGTTQTGYNGIYNQTTTEMNSYSTKYWWSVNCTDGVYWTNKTFCFNTYEASNSPWWNTSWNYRKQITIYHDKVVSNQTNFPILIDIISDDELKSYTQSDGDDIVFIDTNGYKVYHEIEQYDSSTGHLVAWIKIPNLSSTDNTILYMYYGNPSSINQQNPENVWDSNYVMVQHFKDATGTRYDSTSNNFDATPSNVNHISTGAINGADTFNGLTSYLGLGTNSDLQPINGTISVWLNATATDGFRTIYTGSIGSAVRRHPRLVIVDGAVRFFLTNNIFEEGHFAPNFGDTSISANEMHFVTVTWDGANTILYIDGVTVKTEIQNIVPAGNTNTKRIGGFSPPIYPEVFAGMLDEFRLSNIPRSAGYVKTCFNNQYSPNTFFKVFNEEQIS